MKTWQLFIPVFLIGAAAAGYYFVAPDPYSPAKASVKRALIDPASAQFDELRTATGPDGQFICGTVNAKNKFGGYVGRALFSYWVMADQSAVVRTNTDAFLAGELMMATCYPRLIVPRRNPTSSDEPLQLR